MSDPGCFRKTVVPLLCCLAVLLSLLPSPTPALAASPLPHFSLPSATDGSVIDSANYSGRVVLVNFFATWCQPCRIELPLLIEVQEKYGPLGLTVIGLSLDEGNPEKVAKLVARTGINYPVAIAGREVADEFRGIRSIPVTFLVDRDGLVLRRYDGLIAKKALVRDIEMALQEQPELAQKSTSSPSPGF